jgi:hypothetical protein
MTLQSFSRLYLTHFGPVEGAASHWERVAALLPQYAEQARAALEAGSDREALVARLQAWEEARMRADGVEPGLWPGYGYLAPASMSADGLRRYWTKRGIGA